MDEKYYIYNTEIGKIIITENDGNIINISSRIKECQKNALLEETKTIKLCFKQIDEYLKGKRKTFDLPFEITGTNFQKKAWQELMNISYGETKTYKEIARNLGNEKLARAVGLANYKNPLFFLVPCHRVIGSKGNLVGYAMGIDAKKKLIEMEKRNV